MEVEQSAHSRRQLLDRAVRTTIHNAFETFSDPTQLLGSELQRNLNSGERERLEDTVRKIRVSVESCVLTHVEDWVRTRGLDEVFEVLDGYDVGKAAEGIGGGVEGGLTAPCVMLPGISLAEVQVECKRRVLEGLKRKLEEREKMMQEVRGEIGEYVERIQSLNEKIRGNMN